MKKYEILNFPQFSEDRGDLIPFEFDALFPFEVRRVYLVTANEGQSRGGHAHIQEQEVFVMASGACSAIVNDGTCDTEIVLDKKNKALFVNVDCWHEFKDFSKDAVMLCFSSVHYLPGNSNYICDKGEFLS